MNQRGIIKISNACILFGKLSIFYLLCHIDYRMQGNHLIIFVKNPVAGKVKTRLANSIGDKKALEVYMHLLELTRKVAEGVDCTRHLFYSDKIDSDDWSLGQFNKHLQSGNDLGEKMKNAVHHILTLGAKRVIIIGSDCPEITSKIVEEAFATLKEKNVCIGPAKDGGYYLLGMRELYSTLFEEKQWSTGSVFEDTLVNLMKNRLSYACLPPLSDVDTISDLHLVRRLIGRY